MIDAVASLYASDVVVDVCVMRVLFVSF